MLVIVNFEFLMSNLNLEIASSAICLAFSINFTSISVTGFLAAIASIVASIPARCLSCWATIASVGPTIILIEAPILISESIVLEADFILHAN